MDSPAVLVAPSGPWWAAHLRRISAAILAGDGRSMVTAWEVLRAEAFRTTEWESMVVVGESAVRIGRATGLTIALSARAHEAYLAALDRARRTASVDGVLCAAEGFAGLGDRELVAHCTAVARRLAGGAVETREWVEAFAARLAPPPTAASPGA